MQVRLPGTALPLLRLNLQAHTMQTAWQNCLPLCPPPPPSLPTLQDQDDLEAAAGPQFTHPDVWRRSVGALACSPGFYDLFAVGYGSRSIVKNTTGLVACYSLLNPGAPRVQLPHRGGCYVPGFPLGPPQPAGGGLLRRPHIHP